MRRFRGHSLPLVILGVIGVAATLVGLMFFAGFWKAGGDQYRVTAYVSDARGIAVNSTVFEAGLPVGMVTRVKRSGPNAILELRVDEGVRPLPVDSKIRLGLRSLAGETNVVLTPGGSTDTVRDGGSLGLSQNEPYTEVDQILTELSGPTRQDARDFFQGLGGGVDGNGPKLNRTLGGFARLVNDSPPLTSTLAAEHEHVADVVEHFGTIMDAIGQRSQATVRFARGARRTFETIAGRSRQFKDTLHNLPYIIKTNYDIVDSLKSGEQIGETVRHLSDTMIRLEPTLDLLGPGSVKGLSVLRELGAASPGLKNLLVGLEDLEPSATHAFPQVRKLFCQANPMLRFIEPYGRDLAAFFSNFGGANSAYVPGFRRGHLLPASIHVDPLHAVRGVAGGVPDQALTALYKAAIFSPLAQSEYGYRALPGPGKMSSPGTGFAGPIDFGAENEFPRVTADC